MGLKILHSADWHLDSPFSTFPQHQRQKLRQELRKIPGRILELAHAEQVDMVLLAGDLFDGMASRETVDLVRHTLREFGVPVFISPGNHDFCAPGCPWLEETWSENVHIFTGELESVVVPELNCRVYGAGYRSMDCPSLLQDFHAQGQERYCVGVPSFAGSIVLSLAAIKVGIIVSKSDSIPDNAPLVLIGASIAACRVLAACMIVPPLDMPPDVISDAIPAAPKADTEAEAAAAPRPTAPAPTVPTVLIALIDVCIMPCTTAEV